MRHVLDFFLVQDTYNYHLTVRDWIVHLFILRLSEKATTFLLMIRYIKSMLTQKSTRKIFATLSSTYFTNNEKTSVLLVVPYNQVILSRLESPNAISVSVEN